MPRAVATATTRSNETHDKGWGGAAWAGFNNRWKREEASDGKIRGKKKKQWKEKMQPSIWKRAALS